MQENGPTAEPAPTRAERVRRLVNRVNLTTPLGFVVARVGRARRRPGPYGLVLVEGYRLGFPVAGAFTIGDVVVTARTFAELHRTHPDLLTHEERHSRQYAVLGLAFLPLYGLATAWSALRTGDRASGNVFERRAGLLDGGYVERPVRPLAPALAAAATRLGRPGGAARRGFER